MNLKSTRGVCGRATRVALALVCALLTTVGAAFAQMSSQLTIGSNTTRVTVEKATVDSGEKEYTSIEFAGPYALTLRDGETIKTILVSRQPGASLILGDGDVQGQNWRIASNNQSWYGSIVVETGNTLSVSGGVANPLGAYAQDNRTSSYGSLVLYNGANFQLPAREIGFNGVPINGETRIGALVTATHNDSVNQDPAVVNVGAGQTLSVENGLFVDPSSKLTKTGAGTLQFLANGTQKPTTTSSGVEVLSDITSFNFGDADIQNGTLTLKDGSMQVGDAEVHISSIHVRSGATLDVQYAGKIELEGSGGVVFEADDDAVINLYVDKNDSTSYVATGDNAYMVLGATTLNIDSSVRGADLPETMTVFSARDVGQVLYNNDRSIKDIKVVDNLLGKSYVVDEEKSTGSTLALKLKRNDGFSTIGKTPNERELGNYLDRFVDSDSYNDDEYRFLRDLEENMSNLDLSKITGELHASTVGFTYMNNLTATQTLFDTLRNNALVAYSGDSAVAPMDYEEGNFGRGSQSNGYQALPDSFDQQPLYYNTDTNSYGPGVVPISNTGAYTEQPVLDGGIYNGETYGTGTGGMSGGSFDPNGYNTYDSGYNFGWTGETQASTLSTYRGQETTYGDPGTLIYSAWLAVLGGSMRAREHKSAPGYNGKQGGLLLGLDLFCSCDCRFGAYYGFQDNKLKNLAELGKLKTENHQIGLYHQFGDETIYNIASVRGGFDRYRTTRDVPITGGLDTLTAKYRGWNAGASFEHGANFAARPFVFSPYASVDYNYFHRNKFTETSSLNPMYALHVGKSDYHSLRGQIGGRVALDMYPGSQQVRIVAQGAYIHEFLNPTYGKSTMSFSGFGGSSGGFNIYGNSLGRDWALLGAGLDWTPVPALVLFAKGDYVFNKYVRDPVGSAGLKYRW
ncbi:MAG: autotransporter outer membrane beta-barrel domain-containing protein [Thermoguttaceae bacterium]|nr:autotransporter outer membrane beta-barrel domain-containing protein [Thermoguttaceae bacterium]